MHRPYIEVRPMVLGVDTKGEYVAVAPQYEPALARVEARVWSVYLGVPGEFEWEDDFQDQEQALQYAKELEETLGYPVHVLH